MLIIFSSSLLFGLLILINVEVSQLVGLLCVGNDAEPISQFILFQEFLCQIFQVSKTELDFFKLINHKMFPKLNNK